MEQLLCKSPLLPKVPYPFLVDKSFREENAIITFDTIYTHALVLGHLCGKGSWSDCIYSHRLLLEGKFCAQQSGQVIGSSFGDIVCELDMNDQPGVGFTCVENVLHVTELDA